MWWRFLVFCILVSFILFVVASCIYGRPAVHLFFHRCCGEDIENDQVLFENFGNNFLKERLVGGDIIEADNETLFEVDNIERIIDDMKKVLSINDPEVRKWIKDVKIGDSEVSDNYAGDYIADKDGYGVTEDIKLLSIPVKDNEEVKFNTEVTGEETEDYGTTITSKYEILEKANDPTETDSDREFMNVHDKRHRRFVDISV